MNELINLSAFYEIFMVNVSDRKTNVGCLMLMSKPVESMNRQLLLQSYQTVFEDCAARSNACPLMKDWLTSYLEKSKSNVCKILYVAAGPMSEDIILPNNLRSLITLHCVESNIHLIQKFWQKCNMLSMIDKQLQLMKAKQSLLAENGSIVIFHEDTAGPQVELQHLFSMHHTSYNSSELKNDLLYAGIQYAWSLLETILDVSHGTDNLFNFFLERCTTEHEKKKLSKYLDSIGNIIPVHIVAIAIKHSHN